MKALRVTPMTAGTAALDEVPEPPESDGPVLVETIAIGVCGTDIEIISGNYGWPPPGSDRLVLGSRITRPGARRPRPGQGSQWAISSWASCAARIRCRASTAPSVSGTSVATASTPSAGSSSTTATAPSATASPPTSWSRSTRSSGRSECCWSRRASSRRHGSRSTGSVAARTFEPEDGRRDRCRPDRPACRPHRCPARHGRDGHRPGDGRAQARSRRRPRCALSHRHDRIGGRLRPTS